MSTVVSGIVKGRLIVPSMPLPEGAIVEIVILQGTPSFSPELQAEIEGWDRASAKALELIERLAT